MELIIQFLVPGTLIFNFQMDEYGCIDENDDQQEQQQGEEALAGLRVDPSDTQHNTTEILDGKNVIHQNDNDGTIMTNSHQHIMNDEKEYNDAVCECHNTSMCHWQ